MCDLWSGLPFLGHRGQWSRSAVLPPRRPEAAPKAQRREEEAEPWGGGGHCPAAACLPRGPGVAKTLQDRPAMLLLVDMY